MQGTYGCDGQQKKRKALDASKPRHFPPTYCIVQYLTCQLLTASSLSSSSFFQSDDHVEMILWLPHLFESLVEFFKRSNLRVLPTKDALYTWSGKVQGRSGGGNLVGQRRAVNTASA